MGKFEWQAAVSGSPVPYGLGGVRLVSGLAVQARLCMGQCMGECMGGGVGGIRFQPANGL